MKIHCGYEISYRCPAVTPMVLLLRVRPEREGDLLTPDLMRVEPEIPLRTFRDGFGNIATRLLAPEGELHLHADFTIADHGRPDEETRDLPLHAVDDLPNETLAYLLGSRYCEVEPLSELAWAKFGATPADGRRVQAIVDYAHARIRFGYEHASPERTAFGAHEDRRGVCRDYAHLAIALCRCMNIPARYVCGYLGDIRVPAAPEAMDFAAWFEAYLAGAWRTFDARHNQPRIGRVPIAIGRDAADAAIATTFGRVDLLRFKVITEELTDLEADTLAR
ncbi:MAG: transglutaminase family protein [Verrucomicrobiota bacterium]|nr:transglutaminase family protein [Verrucomicrobiota bacterium]